MFRTLGCLALLCITPLVSAQTCPDVIRYGKACRVGTTVCHEKNWIYTTNTLRPPTSAWIYLRATVPAGQTLNVSGFELLLRSLSGAPVRVRTELWSGTPNGPTTRLHTGTEVYVATSQQACSTWFPATSFGPGAIFYLAYFNPSGGVSLGATADPRGVSVRWHVGGAQQVDEAWKYRVLCGGATPNLRVSGLPWRGSTVTVTVDNVPNGVAGFAVLWLGVSKTSFAGLQLPLDLGLIGAPQCDLNCSLDLALGGTSSGGNVWSYSLFIPGFVPPCSTFYLTWIVAAPGANAADLATSEAAELVTG